jgi:hypothetical protein
MGKDRDTAEKNCGNDVGELAAKTCLQIKLYKCHWMEINLQNL